MHTKASYCRASLHKVQVVGNRITDCSDGIGIELAELRPSAADVLVANNTLLRNRHAVAVCDDHIQGKNFLNCNNVRIQNNLILDPPIPDDMTFQDHDRGKGVGQQASRGNWSYC